MRRAVAAAFVAAAAACGPAAGQGIGTGPGALAGAGLAPGLEVTLRPDDAIVVERRFLEFRAGEQSIELLDLGSQVSQLTLRAASGSDDLVVLEQHVVPGAFPVADPKSRAGLTPKVQLRVRAARAGRQLVELTYSLRGLRWHAEHRLTLATAAATELEIDTRIVVDDDSGRDLRGAAVTLVEPGAAGEASRSYRLRAPLAVASGREVRVPLSAPLRVSARRVTRFDGTGGLLAPQSQELEPYYGTAPAPARATEELRLGGEASRLPAGRVQLYQEAPVGLLLAETSLEVDPASGLASVPLGPGYALSGQRRRLALDWGERRLVERFEVAVRNDADTAREVEVFELLYRTPHWRIVDESVRHAAVGARAVEFPLTVGPRQRGRVRYAVEYTW